MSPAPTLYAIFGNYDLLIEALDARRQELNLTCLELDDVAGVPRGYIGKCFGGSQTKRVGWKSTFKIVKALGLRLTLEADERATNRILATRTQRHASQSRPGNYASPPSMRVLRRVQRHLSKRGGKRRWEGKSREERRAHMAMLARKRWGRPERRNSVQP